MPEETISITLRISAPDSDDRDVDNLTQSLQDELKELDYVRSAERVKANIPSEDAKGGLEIGTLLISLIGTSGVAAFMTALGNWLVSGRGRYLEITINGNTFKVPVDSLGKPEVQAMLDWFKIQTSMHFER
ncbi:MAG: hypothetical protein WCI88_15000 [Chloroflexota bacterium]